jgi:hypothetical protein
MDTPLDSSRIEKAISVFKDELKRIINIFFRMKNMYEHDDDYVLKALPLFREYLASISKKYPGLKLKLVLQICCLVAYFTRYIRKSSVVKSSSTNFNFKAGYFSDIDARYCLKRGSAFKT